MKDFLKIILITYIVVFSKIFLQGLIGTILNVPILPYDLMKTFKISQVDFLLIIGWLLYEFLLIFFAIYVWIDFLLFALIKYVFKKNSLTINVIYFIGIYSIYCFGFYNFYETKSIDSFIISGLLGIINFFCIKYFFKEIKNGL